MADNFEVTAGVGTAIRAVEKSSKKHQVVVLDIGGAGAESLLTDRLPFSSPGGINISVTPTITAGAYSAKDAVGGMMTFANAVSGSGKSGILNTVTIIDNDDEKAPLELWLFNADPSGVADNAPMDFTDANMLKCVGIVPISSADYFSLADNGAACVRGIGLQFQCAATSLFGQLKCTGTPAYTATSDITVVLGIEYLN